MLMLNSSASQKGGESNFRGIDYQKKIIGYLCLQMLAEEKIKKITCEHLDDIEVQENSKVTYYQIKTTSGITLPTSEILSSFGLFLLNDRYPNRKTTHKEYVLVSNGKINNFRVNFERHSFHEFNDKIQNKIINSLGAEDKDDFLKRTYFMKGPPLEEIEDVVVALLLKLLPRTERYDYLKIKHRLLSHINDMCPGPTNIEDIQIINSDETEQFKLEHKTITLEKVKAMIEEHRITSPEESLKHVSKSITFRYNINAYPKEEQLKRIYKVINEFKRFDEGDELQLTYLKKLDEMSKCLIIYKDHKFLEFLKKLIRSTNDKHVILYCLYILHNLILTSKAENDIDFRRYVYNEYFGLFQRSLEILDERFEYSFFKIQHIIEDIRETISDVQVCNMYWTRMVNIIKSIKKSGHSENRLWECIVNLNKCKIKPKWHSWLIKKDEYSPIKNAVIMELKNF